MSNIQAEDGVNEADIKQICDKWVVFIIDEAYRTTFGDILIMIKQTFANTLFFGFTGTPIEDENARKSPPRQRFLVMNCTVILLPMAFVMAMYWVFICSISARLKTMICVKWWRCKKPKRAMKPKPLSMTPKRKCLITLWMMCRWQASLVKMVNTLRALKIMCLQYQTEAHVQAVIDDMLDNWTRLSQGKKIPCHFCDQFYPRSGELLSWI